MLLEEGKVGDNRCKLAAAPSGDLIQSVRINGILVRPVVIKNGEGVTVVCGHNRVHAARLAGLKTVQVETTDDEKLPTVLYRELVRKKHEGTLAPISLLLLFGLFGNLQPNALVNGTLNLPRYFTDPRKRERVCMNDVFRGYALHRRLSMKTIQAYDSLPDTAQRLADTVIRRFHPRVNIFKEIVQLLEEIERKGHRVVPDSIPLEDETALVGYLKTLRYPLYHAIRRRADALQKDIQNSRVTLNFPPYFEGGYADITLRVYAEDNTDSIRRLTAGVSSLDYDGILSVLRMQDEPETDHPSGEKP